MASELSGDLVEVLQRATEGGYFDDVVYRWWDAKVESVEAARADNDFRDLIVALVGSEALGPSGDVHRDFGWIWLRARANVIDRLRRDLP